MVMFYLRVLGNVIYVDGVSERSDPECLGKSDISLGTLFFMHGTLYHP